MLVNVTKENIRNGERNNPESCPIALAIKGKKDLLNALVYCNVVYVYKKENAIMTLTVYDLPEKAIKFVADFDRGNSVKPIKFIAKNSQGGG